MSDDTLNRRVQELEADNARLRSLLDRVGSPTGLRHQVRNTLAMMREVVRRSAEYSEGVEDFAAHLDGRLDAVLRVQNAIANGLSEGVGLRMLIPDEFLAQAVSEGARLHIDGPEVSLRPEIASLLGLAFHELCINAIKFGALSTAAGRIAVGWTAEVGGDGRTWLALAWEESGVGLQPVRVPHRGFGTEVIERGLEYQIGGEGRLDAGRDGLRCTLRLPLAGWGGGKRPAGT